MPLPPDHQMVSAADAGPGAPFTSVECPSDNAKAAAADIRRVAATMLANDDFFFTQTATSLAAKVSKTGDTMTGDLVLDTGVDVAFSSARTYTRVAKGILHIDGTIWQPTGTAGAGFPYLVVQSITITPLALADHLVYAIDPHDGATITAVTARVKGGPLMGGLPANTPIVTLYRVDLTLGTVTSVGAQTDTSANIAAYQALHTVTISGLSEVVDSTKYAYLVRVQGDTGSGGTFGSEFYAPTCTFTRGKLGQE